MNFCPGKNLQVIISIGNLKRKKIYLNNFSNSEVICQNLAIFIKIFLFFPNHNFYSKTIDERKII